MLMLFNTVIYKHLVSVRTFGVMDDITHAQVCTTPDPAPFTKVWYQYNGQMSW